MTDTIFVVINFFINNYLIKLDWLFVEATAAAVFFSVCLLLLPTVAGFDINVTTDLFSFETKDGQIWVEQRTLTIGGSITVRTTSCLTGLDLTRQVKLFFIQHEQSAESKQNKQEVSQTVILTLKLVLSGYRGSVCPVCRINLPPIAQILFARSSLCLGISCSHKKEIKAV